MKIIVLGPAGKMGRAMVQLAHREPQLEITGAVGPQAREYIGRDIGFVCALGTQTGILVSDDLEKIITDCDLVLDCSRPDVAMRALELCVKYKRAFVTGTTGFRTAETDELRRAGASIPVLLAGNASRMVRVFYDLIRGAAKALGRESDIDIIDIFDRKKLDSPSGTSQEIADIVVDELGFNAFDFTYGRQGLGVRKEKSLAFTSIRSGGHPGTVKVVLGLENEKLEIAAQVYNMKSYARGMIDAALFLEGKEPGFYQIENVFQARC